MGIARIVTEGKKCGGSESAQLCSSATRQPPPSAQREMADSFVNSGMSPMVHCGGKTVPEQVKAARTSIFRPVDSNYAPRVNLPPENPKYPETKHTVKCAAPPRLPFFSPSRRLSNRAAAHPCLVAPSILSPLRRKVVHNITAYPVTDRPGTESYDPVLLGGKSVR